MRKRMTEESTPNWSRFFREAVDASNGRKHEVLYGKAPEELYDADGRPEDESAAVAIYGLEKQQAEKQFRNTQKNARKEGLLRNQGAFRVPERLQWKDRRVLQATHGGEVHQVARVENSRVFSPTGRKPGGYPVSTVLAVPRGSRDVILQRRYQTPGRMTKERQRQILLEYVDTGRFILRGCPNQEAPTEFF